MQTSFVVVFIVTVGGGGFLSAIKLSVSGGLPATEPLRRGLNELSDVCQHVLNTFQVSLCVHLVNGLITGLSSSRF